MLWHHDACLAALVHVMCLKKMGEGGRGREGEREGGGRESLCVFVTARACQSVS
jgi:hypothetical protein